VDIIFPRVKEEHFHLKICTLFAHDAIFLWEIGILSENGTNFADQQPSGNGVFQGSFLQVKRSTELNKIIQQFQLFFQWDFESNIGLFLSNVKYVHSIHLV
jgi:hypothetical protein